MIKDDLEQVEWIIGYLSEGQASLTGEEALMMDKLLEYTKDLEGEVKKLKEHLSLTGNKYKNKHKKLLKKYRQLENSRGKLIGESLNDGWKIGKLESKVELLESELSLAESIRNGQGLMVRKLHDENKRYREALEEITTRKMSTFLTTRDMNIHFIKTARKALEVTK